MALKKNNVRLIFLSAFYVLFVLAGATVFWAIEGPIEDRKVRQLLALREKFLENRPDCMSGGDLDEFVDAVIEANQAGISVSHNVTNVPNWSFGQSLFFTTSLITTIGYGHVTTLSYFGKIFCIVYASFGIQLTLILFKALVERLMILTSLMYNALLGGFGQAFRVVYVRLTHVFIVFCLVVVVVFLIPSAIFMIIETDWSFLDAFYFCFLSMTTIGLGRNIPGERQEQPSRLLYKISAALYLIFGLVLILLLVTNVEVVPELNFARHFSVHGDDGSTEAGERQRLQSPSDVAKQPPRYTTNDPDTTSAAADQDTGSGSGGGGVTKRSKKPEDKKPLTD